MVHNRIALYLCSPSAPMVVVLMTTQNACVKMELSTASMEIAYQALMTVQWFGEFPYFLS